MHRLTHEKRDGKKSGKAETQINEWALLQEELFLAAVHEAGGSVNENGRIVGVNDEEEESSEKAVVRNSFGGINAKAVSEKYAE